MKRVKDKQDKIDPNKPYRFFQWGPFLYKTEIPKYILKRLLKDGKELKESYNNKLAGHLDNQFLYSPETQAWFYKEINPILDQYRNAHCKYHRLQELPVSFVYDDLWVNYMKPGDFNPLHTHGGDYSFVLFLDVPKILQKEMTEFKGTSSEPAALTFEYGVQQRAPYKWATTGTVVYPKTGDLYMFPALLQHWVAPFKSKCTRISVSGNIRMLNKEDLPRDYF